MRLVGILAVVAVLVVGAGIVLDAVAGEDGDQGGGGGVLVPGVVPPGDRPVVPRPADPASRIDAARAVACAEERRRVESALEQHRALGDRYGDGEDLVAAGMLRAVPEYWTVVSDDDFATYRLEPLDPACAGA